MDQKTLAYINMYAILGTLENLCELDEEAQALLAGKSPVSLAFDVKGGPKATLTFSNGRARLEPGASPKANVRLAISSCEKFNKVVSGQATPVPVPGYKFRPAHLSFLLNEFDALTKRLEQHLRASEEDLADPVFFTRSTKLMLYVISVAISQIADYDDIGRFSAGNTIDGEMLMSIKNDIGVTIRVKNNVFATLKKRTETPSCIMEFESLELARALFDGKVSAMSCISNGTIIMGGKIAMLDNVSRILDRVPLYLA